METGKLGSGSCSARSNSNSSNSSIAVPTGTRMDICAPLTAVYIHAVPSLTPQLCPPQLLPAAPQQPATVHLNMPPLYSKDTLPYLTLHIAGGLPTQQQQVSNITSAALLSRPKAAGKHVCPHCGRDCMKPSVLEKHLRCHTGERPYPCTTCGVSFKTQSNLYKHKRTQAHTRLSSESSGHGSMSSFGSVSSQDSAYGSRDTCASSLSLDGSSEESGSLETDVTAAPPRSVEIAKVCSGKKAGRGEDGVGEENQASAPAYSSEPKGTEGQKPPSTASRHLSLQRQEATLFSKQWESSVSKGKSQNHDSTDSGFSESSEQYPGASVVSPEHGKDPNESAGQSGQEPKDNVCARGQKTLEERISKLISENSVVVDDKQLENVRPRKTVLSKQGSIDLPMPYTYKDSFHFDMRLSKAPNVGLQKHRVPALYSSVPTQRSTSVEHTPLTRSSSLPFNVTLLQPERSSPNTSFQRDYARRGSSGQIHPASLAITSVDQQVPNHRLLVRQAAVDCNHATDFVHSSAEEEGCNSSPVCGGDICEEPSNKKYRRKKAQKFAYNKWYMYGGGTFKKLYSPEKGCDNGARKSVCNPEHSAAQGVPKEFSGGHKGQIAATGSAVTSTNSSGAAFHPTYLPPGLVPGVDIHQKAIQLHPSCTPLKAPLHRNLSLSTMQLPLVGSSDAYNTQNVSRAETHQRLVAHTGNTLELRKTHIPSDGKAQRTNYKIACPEEMETGSYVLAQPAPCLITSVPQPDTNQKAIQKKENLLPQVIINAKGTSGSTPSASHTLSTAKTDFLPKYQLKLPNAAKQHANSSPHSLAQSTMTNKSGSPSAVTSTATEKDDSLIAEAPQVSSLTAAALCHPETSWTAAPTVSAVHRQFTTITTTTATMHNHPAKRCTTTQVSPSNPVTGSIPWQLPERAAPVLRSQPTAVTKEGNHSPPTAFKLPSQSHNPIVSDTCALPTHTQLTLERGKTVDQKAPVLPCNMPYDSAQPAAQNVFHVQTADLQICLQIISDEQLALMEPQIERWGSPAEGSLAQRSNLEAMKPDHIQSAVQTSVSTEILSNGRGHENTRSLKGAHQREPLFSHNPESIKPPTHFESARQSVFIADRGPAASVTHACAYYGSSGVPSNLHSHYDMIQDTGRATGHVSLLRGTVSGRSQTAEEKHTFPLSNLTEVHMIPQRNVSQKAKACDAICAQNKLNLKTTNFFSPGTPGENEAGNALLQTGSQQKPLNHSAIGNMDTLTDKCEGSVCEHITLENGKTHSPVQETECDDALPESIASDERQATSPATLNSIDMLGSALGNSSIQSFENRDRGHDSIGSLTHSAPSRDKTLCESQNKIYSAQSEKHQSQFTSVAYTVQAEKTSLGICTENQSPVAGSADGGSLAACPEQEELGTGQQDGIEWEPNQSPEARERCNHCESVEIREVAGQQGPGGSDSCTETDEVLGLWERSKCNSRSGTDMSNLKNTEDEEKKGKAASNENSRLSEPHHQHPSQEHSGMLEHPQPQQQQPNMLNNSDPPDSRLLGPPPPQKKLKSVFFSQQSSETHNQQMETLRGTDSTLHTDNSCVLQMENENGPPQCQQPLQNGTISDTKYQKQTGISLKAHTLPERETCSTVHSSVLSSPCCESESSTYSHTAPSLSSEGTDSSFTHHSQAFNSVCTGDLRAEQINAPATNNGFPETTMHPLKFWTPVYPDAECVTEQDFGQRATQNHTIHHNDPAKYQLLFSAGPLPSYTLECPANGLRPVQNCQDYPDDTSSSDDEGKLIIEL